MDEQLLAQQTVTGFLQAVKARRKRAALAYATREFQTRLGDNAGNLYDIVGGRRAALGRSAFVGDHVLAEIWLRVTYYSHDRTTVHRDTLVVRLELEEGQWRIADAEIGETSLPGHEKLRGQPDPGAPELPDAIAKWMADHAAGRTSQRPDNTQDVPGPFEGPLDIADEFRACMVKKERKRRRVQARLSAPGKRRRRWLLLTFQQRGESWVLTGWEDT